MPKGAPSASGYASKDSDKRSISDKLGMRSGLREDNRFMQITFRSEKALTKADYAQGNQTLISW